MGYNTTFKGSLSFTSDPTAKQLAKLKSFFGEDCRDHPEWGAHEFTGYIDLRLTDDFSGVEWDDETEKTYGLEDSVNVVIREMRKEFPDFGLTGTLIAQGEEFDDRWALAIGEDGFASKQPLVIPGKVIKCPHCGSKFGLEA